MNYLKSTLLISTLAATGAALAVNFGEKPDTPELPGGKYVVHDGTRPQPKKVATKGAVNNPAPGDAIVLFDGSNLDEWTGGAWKIDGDRLIAADKDLQTKKEFRDVQLHIEWRVPAGRKVNGQSGGNSGIFFMGKYECQVLQCLDNKTYPDGQAGAMYGQYPPLVNASVAQGEWQSYDIVFMAPRYEGEKVVEPAKLTVFHNGVLLHNAKEYLGTTSHKTLAKYPAKHPEKGPIRLQWHNDPVEYRNIWIREIGDYDQGE
ncbi:MAG: 3-keto-disaccharide hydrolase [Verrucomicrobiales bacterium]